jgi:hypothetical protein
LIAAGGYIFNTEAHPLDPGIIYCCSAKKHKDAAMIQQFEDNIDLVQMLGLAEESENGHLLDDLVRFLQISHSLHRASLAFIFTQTVALKR